MHADEPVKVVDKFVYLGSCITPGCLTKDGTSIRTGKARAAFVSLCYLWRRLIRQGWSLQCWVWWDHRISNAEVRRIVFARSNSPTIDELITLQSLRWLGHVLRMPIDRLPRILFAEPCEGWKRADCAGHYRLPEWGSRGGPHKWLETLPSPPSMALMYPRYCLQCIAPFPTPPLNSPLTVLYLRTNLSAPASNAQLHTPPPRIIGQRYCSSYNHCTTMSSCHATQRKCECQDSSRLLKSTQKKSRCQSQVRIMNPQCLAAMPPKGSASARIRPGYSSLHKRSRDARVSPSPFCPARGDDNINGEDARRSPVVPPGVTAVQCIDLDGLCLASKGPTNELSCGLLSSVYKHAQSVEDVDDFPVVVIEQDSRITSYGRNYWQKRATANTWNGNGPFSSVGPQPKHLAQKLNRKAAVFGGKCKCITVSTEQVARCSNPNPEGQVTVFVRPLIIDQPDMRDSVSVTGTFPSITQWIAEGPQPKHLAQKLNRKAAVFGGKCKCITVSTEQVARCSNPNPEGQVTVFVRPLIIDQPDMRDSVSVTGTFPSITQWIAEVREPSHHGKVQSLRDSTKNAR
ncbi:hypothetical protein T265_05450 [Opisthorchis viverrini]|uniref:Uncharacterized protein n=1 Tax=Opisthorchis viverrini TaxID=6198 RepID=A0A075AF91_OPIVI|nr:hypothetical protein T265_05450 [Opisthorchis viverrini]KER27484.1 hypothetical protein T265_05450 [Opisthorchis viverrini]